MSEYGEHFIREIEIKNYKLFKDFKADGFGRVNLIGGKNNVGKTAFMEACFINSGSFDLKQFVFHMWGIKFMRENLNILVGNIKDDTKNFIELLDNLNIKSNINNISFKIEDKNGIKEYHFEYNNHTTQVNINDFSFDINRKNNNNFIDSFGLTYSEIITAYSYVQKQDKEEHLNDILKKFDSRIESFKIIDEKPQCKIDGIYRELTEFGDGVRHIVSIVTELYKSENGHLYIDEIDNGIHYTMLDELWEIILTISKEQNVQVFATTHSKECIESFNRVQKKLNDEDIFYFEMYKNIKNDNISMRQLDAKQLEYELNHQGRYRGE